MQSSAPRLSAREVCVRLIGPHGGLHTARHGKGLVSTGRFTRKNGARPRTPVRDPYGARSLCATHTPARGPQGLGAIGFKPPWKTKAKVPGRILWTRCRANKPDTGLPVLPCPRGPDARKPPPGLKVGSSGARGFIQSRCAVVPVTMSHVILTRA